VSSWAAVVVNYEAGDHLLGCVQALTGAGASEVVVVDNGSTDGSTAAVRRECPAAVVIDPGANLGYSRAVNLGTAATTAEFVMVCNPDVVVDPGVWAPVEAAFAADAQLAAVGPRILNPDGSTYPSARRLPSTGDAIGHGALGLVWSKNPFTRRYRELDADPAQARAVDWVSGAALWLRRRALDDVGGWDERFFMYAEDVELGWRLTGSGWHVRYEPAAVVEHVQGVSTAGRPDRMIVEHHRSVYRFADKRWRGPWRVLLPAAALYLSARAGLAVAGRHLLPQVKMPRVDA